MVRWMRMHGKAAFGVELSHAVLDRDAPDLLEAGFVEQGSLTDLPYQGEQPCGLVPELLTGGLNVGPVIVACSGHDTAREG